MDTQKQRSGKGIVGASVLIFIGTLVLLQRTGVISHQVISQGWPLLLIGLGAALLYRRLGRSTQR